MAMFNDLVRQARAVIESDYFDLDEDGAYEAAHEYADSHADVIYYAGAIRLYADGVISDEDEAEAADLADPSGPGTIAQQICRAAYFTVRRAFLQAWEEYDMAIRADMDLPEVDGAGNCWSDADPGL